MGEVETSLAPPAEVGETVSENFVRSLSGYDKTTEGSRGVRRGLDCLDEPGCLYENDDDGLTVGGGR